MAASYQELRQLGVENVRRAIRSTHYRGHTAGLADGYLQANLVILERAFALDFMRYCQRNPKPCPLVGISDDGDPMMRTLGHDIDIRTDIPSYNIYRNGILHQQRHSIADIWRDDLVAFALGCSFTFEHELQRHGIEVRNIKNNTTVPMFRSTIPTIQAGPFHGPMVVSMRPIQNDRVDQTIQISRQYPLAHGGPVHEGDPKVIGITDINKPDWGDASAVQDGEVPVFWACGVTPQAAIAAAKIPFSITHTPGCMLITDISETAEVPVIYPSIVPKE